MIEVRHLAFSYSGSPVLRDVSFVVSPGEIVSIVGANGAGKTTLLKVLATLAVPDGGRVFKDGKDALGDLTEYRRHLGYLPETPALYEDMSVKDYLNFRASLKGEPSKRVRRRVADAAECCRVGDILRRPIRRLSYGQRKRVALADAILARPKLLLLDDFLSGLDAEMRLQVKDALSEVAAYSSVLITGHDIDDLARFSSRFLHLKDGVIDAEVDATGLGRAEAAERVRELLTGGGR